MGTDKAIASMRQLIMAESTALAMLAETIDDRALKAVSVLWMCRGKIIVTGMGKAGNVGAKIAATLRSTGSPAAFLHPGEALHGDMGMVRENDVLLALSNSGETEEVLGVAEYCKANAIEIVAITSKPESTLAGMAKMALILPSVPEGCPIGRAPMSSATMMMVLGDAMAGRMMEMRDFTDADFLKLHHGGYLGRAIRAVA